MSHPVRIVGVDPGLRGAIALVECRGIQDRKVLDLIDLRDFGHAAGHDIDMPRLCMRVREMERNYPRASLVVAERPSAMPASRSNNGDPLSGVARERGQGVASAFNFGSTCGALWGMFVALGYHVQRPQPAAWKAVMGLSANKRECCTTAATLFPDQARMFWGSKHGALDGRAEAVLLAVFGQRFVIATETLEQRLLSEA